MNLGPYSRKFRDLQKQDVYVLGKSHNIEVSREYSREKNMKLILQQHRNLADEPDKLYFFKVYMYQNQKLHGFVHDSESPTTNEYPETVGHGPKCDIDKILLEIDLEVRKDQEVINGRVEPSAPPDVTPKPAEIELSLRNTNTDIQNSDARTQTLLAALVDNQLQFQNHTMSLFEKKQASYPSKHKHYNAKLVFEEDKGIEQFLSLIESYCDANDITNDHAKVKVALASLDASDHGLTLKESLVGNEKTEWLLFKNKLIAVLGKDYEYYDELFGTFKRGTLSPGLALAKLTLYYKKSFPCYRENLNTDDERKILRAFIRCLDQPIQGLVKSEEYRLTIETIANRVQQLERAFCVSKNPLINIITEPAVPPVEPIIDQILKLEIERSQKALVMEKERSKQQNQLFSAMNNLISNISTSSKTSAFTKKADPGPRVNKFAGLKNFCLHHILGNCRYDKCKFIHASGPDVPQSVLDVVEKLRVEMDRS